MDTHNQIPLNRNLPGPHLLENHLSDEQFTDLLLGTIPPSVTAHLDACQPCAQEAQRVSGAIGSFEQQSRLWAERRAATRPVQAPATQPLLAWLRAGSTAWYATAAALILATVVGLGIAHRSAPAVAIQQPIQQPAQQQVAAIQPAPQVSPATLKADNELLSAIDGELSADAVPPANLYGLRIGTHAARTKSLKRMSN